ncbi:hypothetical protein SUBVAR_04170 [Subdoligranulum variabile DSM 15176]|uniref:Uncharacterized protein n=1 Tax=Subdoligranulum variabile DSM 15176 TaxID=411471 RepID=D1PIK5_9FIRM|nr:hypothetical protein SUBVAR_04170 [Subdoligranulum variabile DSM 15176]
MTYFAVFVIFITSQIRETILNFLVNIEQKMLNIPKRRAICV